MKEFGPKEFKEAVAHSEAGGEALLILEGMSGYPGAPACFKRSPLWGHLYDQDAKRLEATARRLGIKRVKIDRLGVRGQHVDLCGKPLEKAFDEAEK